MVRPNAQFLKFVENYREGPDSKLRDLVLRSCRAQLKKIGWLGWPNHAHTLIDVDVGRLKTEPGFQSPLCRRVFVLTWFNLERQ
jgi:hypothetical protein